MTDLLPTRSETTTSRPGFTDARNALLCGLAVVAAVVLTNPICESPFNDDWSYSFTVQKLLETGRLTYNGWASASLIAQAYWGLIWVKVFGFSYTVLRLSTLPLAAAAVSICYLLARRVGLSATFAAFSTLMLGLSPLYLPVASSFMTDAPGLFFIMLSMYALTRGMESRPTGRAIAWLMLGALVGLVGGTGRQFAWVVPLVMLPFAAWVRRYVDDANVADAVANESVGTLHYERKDVRRINMVFVLCAMLGWIVVLAGALGTVHWFNHQPYAIPEIPLSMELKFAAHKPANFLFHVAAIPLTTIWVILPAVWGIVSRGWNGNRALVSFLLLIGPVLILAKVRPQYAVAPWMGNTLSAQGVMGGAELAGDRPNVLVFPVRVAIGIAVFSVACVLITDILLWLTRPLKAVRKTMRFLLFPDSSQTLLAALTWFALAYCTLLLPRCASNMAYDRYILPLMPCVLFPLLLSYQRKGETKVPASGWILLGIYTLFAIGITQEITALIRARSAAANLVINRLVSEKTVPTFVEARELIDAGFEFDYETQLFATGYINDPRIHNPKGAYKKNFGPTYTVQSLYRLEFAPAPDTEKTDFGHVDYMTYLYPFHRRIYIDKFSDAWWLDPRKAATRPADKWHSIISPDMAGDEAK